MPTGEPASEDLLAASWQSSALPAAQVSLALLAQAQGGDRLALHELIERYQDRLRRIVRIQLGSSPIRRFHDSMDVVQSTFLAALPKIGELRPRSAASLLHWLAMIATNQIHDAHDHQIAAKRDSRRDVPIEMAADAHHQDLALAATNPDPALSAELAEIRDLLDHEVAALPDDQRRVVLLRDYCGESWEHIASELQREVGAARQLHQRAWIRLRRALRPLLEAEQSDS